MDAGLGRSYVCVYVCASGSCSPVESLDPSPFEVLLAFFFVGSKVLRLRFVRLATAIFRHFSLITRGFGFRSQLLLIAALGEN